MEAPFGLDEYARRQAVVLKGLPLFALTFQTLGMSPIVPSLCHLTSCPGIVYSDLATVGPDASSRSPGSCSRAALVAALCAQRYLATDRSSPACGGCYRGREHDILVSYISSSCQIRQHASR